MPQPSLLAELEEFMVRHRPHGQLSAEAGEPTENGYLLEVACSCGVVFGRCVTPDEAPIDLSSAAGLN
jgi:hypothetical protein